MIGVLCVCLSSGFLKAIPGIPDRIGKFRIEIAEPGNDFVEPEKKKDLQAELPADDHPLAGPDCAAGHPVRILPSHRRIPLVL